MLEIKHTSMVVLEPCNNRGTVCRIGTVGTHWDEVMMAVVKSISRIVQKYQTLLHSTALPTIVAAVARR